MYCFLKRQFMTELDLGKKICRDRYREERSEREGGGGGRERSLPALHQRSEKFIRFRAFFVESTNK